MFTGIITAVGAIRSITPTAGQSRFRFATGGLDMTGARLGDSIAVNGACLTVIELHEDGFSADLSRETLELTTHGEARPDDRVNLERALSLGDELGGHLVTGHVDGVGSVISMEDDGGSSRLAIRAPGSLPRYIARKGSVCVDGVSLTVNAVQVDVFELMIVPHTQANTIISGYAPGTRVNIEVDIIARYVERMAAFDGSQASSTG